MITFKEIADRIDKSKENEAPIELYKLTEELGVDNMYTLATEEFAEKNNKRLSCYYIKKSWWEEEASVSLKMYFLDGESMGISTHSSYVEYSWFGLGKVKRLKGYLTELFERDDESYLDFIELEDGAMEEFYKIYDETNAIANKEYVYYNGEKVIGLSIHPIKRDVVSITTTKSDKRFLDVLISDLDFKLHILDEK